MKYHAVMLDETHCEFGVDVDADTRDEAYAQLEEDYPESSVVQLESSSDTADRMYQRIMAEEDGDFSQWEYEQEWN